MTNEYIDLSVYVLTGLLLYVLYLTGWEYYPISKAMQYSNTALETTSLVMYDSKSFSYVLPFFVMALRIL